MKKITSAFVLLLTLIQAINMQCLAKCEIPSVFVKELNLDSKILEEKGFFEKSFDDKTVNVTAINKMDGFISELEKKLANSYKKMVLSWNSNLNEKTIDIISASLKDILSGKYGTENAEALIKGLKYLKEVSMNVKLSDEEKIKAVEEGRIRSEIGLIASKGVGIAGGLATAVATATSGTVAAAAGAAGSAVGTGAGMLAGGATAAVGEGLAAMSAGMASGTTAAAITTANALAGGATAAEAITLGTVAGNVATTIPTAATAAAKSAVFWKGVAGAAGNVFTAVGTTVSSALTPVLIVGATVAAGYGSYKLLSYLTNTVYNKYFSEKPYNEAAEENLKMSNLLSSVMKSVCEHDWIGNNILTTATSKDKYCDKTFVNFEKMKGVNYNKTKEEINNDFAALECKLLGLSNNENCKKEALKSINCHWENVYDTSKCSLNPYYRNIVEHLAQDAGSERTNKEEL